MKVVLNGPEPRSVPLEDLAQGHAFYKESTRLDAQCLFVRGQMCPTDRGTIFVFNVEMGITERLLTDYEVYPVEAQIVVDSWEVAK